MTDIPVGPVCHLPSPTVAVSPNPQALPPIPPAKPDLASLTATVNALRQAVLLLSGLNGAPGTSGTKADNNKSGSWKQKDLETEVVKIYQNNDPSTGVFVEVQRINKLVFDNSTTKQTITFNRPPDPSGT